MERKLITNLTEHDADTINNFRMMLSYFELHDILDHTTHSNTLYEIYLNRRNFMKSNVALILATHLGDNTFYKYRNMYLKCYDLISRGEFQIWSEAAFSDALLPH